MGLADRFKDSLDKKDIFTSKKNISAISNPIKKNRNFEDLETEIIDKIRKTPYWNEYSKSEQQKMIGAYFSKKLQNKPYSNIEKEDFIQNILILSNHY